MNIIVGVLSSLIATIVWVAIIQLYTIGRRKKIDYILEACIDSSRLFEYSIDFFDYDTALIQVDRIIDSLIKISDCIQPLTYSPKKKKFFFTYIFNALHLLSVFKNTTVGYERLSEKEARCANYKRKWFYSVIIDETDEIKHETYFLTQSLRILQELNRSHNLKKRLNRNSVVSTIAEDRKKTYLSIISIFSFSDNFSVNEKYYMNLQTFTKKEYQEFIIKHVKG